MALDMASMAGFLAQAQASGNMQHLQLLMSMMQPQVPAMPNLMQPAQTFMMPGQNLLAAQAGQNLLTAQAVSTGVEASGTLKAFGQKGYGYITPDDGSEDVFFHLQAVQNGNEMSLIPGVRLKYEMGMDSGSGKTKAVKVLLDAPGSDNMQPATPLEVETFLTLNPVDENAQLKLRSVDPLVQRIVINRGSLEGARDPTATILGRISKGQAYVLQTSGYGPAAGAMSMMKGGPYGKGGGKLAAPENETLFVKSLPLESTFDTVLAIFSQYGGVQSVKVLPASGGRAVVAAFVTMNSVQEAKWILENVNGQVPMGLQNPVEIMFATPKEPAFGKGKDGGKGMMMPQAMMGGCGKGMMMPQAMMGGCGKGMMMPPAMMANPQAATQTLEAGQTGTLKAFGQKGYGYITPDDGSEDVFFHLQSVLNGNEMNMTPGVRLMYEIGMDPSSGKTKAVKVLLDTPSAASSFGSAVPATPVEVEQFLILNPVEQHAQDKFRGMDPHIQKWVINRGPFDMNITRDPTGALIARMNKLEWVATGQVHVPPGDWICQNCGDHQFARNQTCRSCGAPKPDNLGIALTPM